jgi:hypothetical protein
VLKCIKSTMSPVASRHCDGNRSQSLREILRYPNPVNEVSVRLTAGVMAILSWIAVFTQSTPLIGVIAATFLLRVAAGPRFDPVSWTVNRFVSPRLNIKPRPTPGPPKRFAQLIGVVFTVAAFGLALAGAGIGAAALMGIVAVFATLESTIGFCAGCQVFAVLMRVGVIPESVCVECADLSLRWGRSAS